MYDSMKLPMISVNWPKDFLLVVLRAQVRFDPFRAISPSRDTNQMKSWIPDHFLRLKSLQFGHWVSRLRHGRGEGGL